MRTLRAVAVSVVVFLVFAGTAWALHKTVSTTLAASSAAPTLATQGLDLAGLEGYSVCVQAPPGARLSDGGGVIQAFKYNYTLSLWGPDPELNKTVTISDAGLQCFPDQRTVAKYGRVYYATQGLTSGTLTSDGGTNDGGYVVVIEGTLASGGK